MVKDALTKQLSGKPLDSRIDNIIFILDNSHRTLRHYQADPVISIAYLEGVAGMRYAMMELATLLHSMFAVEQDRQQYLQLVRLGNQLVQISKEVCTDPAINTTNFAEGDVIGPAVYLLKLLVRQYGFGCLKKVSAEHEWLVPEGLRTSDQVCVGHARL
jgi:hypothetical protein